MFYNVEKLNELEKTLSENLMKADGHTWNQNHKPHWINYRNDIPNCLCVIREYRSMLEQMKAQNESRDSIHK